MGIVCATVLPLSLYTLVTARKRYYDWVDRVVAAYLDHVEKATRDTGETNGSTATRVAGGPRSESSVRGSILIWPGERSIITLTENADASTIVHEEAHDWLEQLRRDALHPVAPAQLRADGRQSNCGLGARRTSSAPKPHWRGSTLNASMRSSRAVGSNTCARATHHRPVWPRRSPTTKGG